MMSDYIESLDSIDINTPGTGTDVDATKVVNEYKGAPTITENTSVKEEAKEFDTPYSAPKKIIVKRYKLKKM